MAFCDSVGARKIQDSVLGQVFGHYYCTDVAGLAQLSRAHTRFNVVTFLLSITLLFLVFFFNEFFNVSSALKEYCFFHAK